MSPHASASEIAAAAPSINLIELSLNCKEVAMDALAIGEQDAVVEIQLQVSAEHAVQPPTKPSGTWAARIEHSAL